MGCPLAGLTRGAQAFRRKFRSGQAAGDGGTEDGRG